MGKSFACKGEGEDKKGDKIERYETMGKKG